MILETNLNDLVGEAEHDGVLRAHPLLDIHDGPSCHLLCCLISHLDIAVYICRFAASWPISPCTVSLSIVLQVRPEVLKESHFLLKFLRVVK